MTKKIIIHAVGWIIILAGLSWGWSWYQGKNAPSEIDSATHTQQEAVAYVAGGCFWCTESDFEQVDGVKEAISGYMGGDTNNPSYKEVASGASGHREVVKVVYDPNTVDYRRLVLELLRETDPTDAGGTFYDRGFQYTSAVYYQTLEEKLIAQEVIAEVDARGVFEDPIVTSVEKAGEFWVAEDYHQDYYKKSFSPYKRYRKASGRDEFIEAHWGSGVYDDLFTAPEKKVSKWEGYEKPSDAELKKALTPLQYDVTQHEGTERPFHNEYWDNHEDGIYVDIVSGEPLFSSTHKYDSGTGWPSFLRPIEFDFVTEHDDYKLIVHRTEIRSRYADSHLGHIILDGPESNDRIRYCMNSAAMRFVPFEDMEQEGYGEYLYLFK